jgi:glyoxylase-like metal-dependent hydrolase (beta-lactamase superfamily II)
MIRGKQPGPPRITFNNRATVRLGGKEVRMYHYGRGHTNGDVFVLFPNHRILHAGDMFNPGGPFIDYGNGGSGIEWSETIFKALQLDFERVIPGHGPVLAKKDLQAWNDGWGAVRMRISELKRQGKSKEQAAKELKTEDLGMWKAVGANWRSAGGLYDELR